MWRGGHRQPDLRPITSRRQRFAGHQFDRRPVLTEEARCVVEIARLHANTAGLSAGSIRYLKVKIEADCFRIFFDRLIISAHLVSPPFCVAHISFTILIFVGRDYGAVECDTHLYSYKRPSDGLTTAMRNSGKLKPAHAHAVLRLVTAYLVFDRVSAVNMRGGQIDVHAWDVQARASHLASQIEGDLGLSPRRAAP
jgi:hypothetical protein